MNIRRTNQGGLVANFIIIGIILVIGLVGAVIFINQRGQQARKDQEIAANEKKQADKKPVTVVSKPVNSSTVSSNSHALPTTGSESTVGDLFVVYLLTVAVVSYLLSRKKLAYSL